MTGVEARDAATQPSVATTCLVPVWDDGVYRVRCGMGSAGVCAKHGPHEPHPEDGRPCEPNPHDGYCHAHGVYMPSQSGPSSEVDRG